MDRRELKRPPEMGQMKRLADAEAPILRAQLRTLMRLDGLSPEEVAQRAGLDAEAVSAFLAGASINPRWQDRLARWLERVIETPE
ncbi:MAG TPA: helix-turn-helix domain-containing protein [Ktedonobacterales bacterium]|jgi:transcriptional regulator with XRE-family HTH domain